MMPKCEADRVGVWLWGGMLERRDQKVPMEKERPGYHQHQEVTTEHTPPQLLQTHTQRRRVLQHHVHCSKDR